MMKRPFNFLTLILCCSTAGILHAQTPRLTLDLTKPGVSVSPTLYGLMTEEINYSYDGGLYGELIKNRIFKNNPGKPEGWSLVQEGDTKADIQLVGADPENVPYKETGNSINEALTTCLKLTVEKPGVRAGIANEGYWGIPVRPATTYAVSFYIKGTGATPPPQFNPNVPPPTGPTIENNTAGIINISIESKDGKTIYASGTIDLIKSIYWKKYSLKLTTSASIQPNKDTRFVISTNRTGLYYFNLVSLFAPTYNNRTNGDRQDITQLLVDMKPTFLRFPGGNFLEGPYLNDHFPWKTTLGPLEQRPGHTGSWGYRATDGMGLLEFLGWCEDVHMEPLLAVYAGYSLRGDHIDAGPLLEPAVQDALDEIEYITGDIHTYWGAKRAADGHPTAFKLNYVEIGNEDWFDRSNSYDGRFNQFRKAINSKYPQLKCISTIADAQFPKLMVVTGPKPYMVDEHYYQNAWQMEEDANKYDSYDRKTSPKIFVGEWATREGSPTTNLNAALGDAAWMTGMERNADLVLRSCFAPLFVNVNPSNPATGDRGGMQWASDLIGYNALNSYGSPSYYVQKMFNNNLGSNVVPIQVTDPPMLHIDTSEHDPQAPKFRMGRKQNPTRPSLYYVATKDTKTDIIYLKVVNVANHPQDIIIDLKGAYGVTSSGTLIELKGNGPEDTNSIDEPQKIIPVTKTIDGVKKVFQQTLAAYSVSVLKIHLITK